MEKNLSKAELFFTKRKNIFKYEILPFLTNQDNLNLGKVNSAFRKSVKKHFKKTLTKFADRLNLQVKEDDERLHKDIFKTVAKTPGFLVNNTQANYVQFPFDNNYKYLALTSGEDWSWCEDKSYWDQVLLPKSTFGIKTYYLKNVCWLDLRINFHSVIPGIYDVYLRQALKKNHSMKNVLSLKIFVDTNVNYKIKDAMTTEIFQTDFMSDEMITELLNAQLERSKPKNNEELSYNLVDTFITTIDLTKYADHQFVKVRIAFWHKNGWWKNGWFIDAGILQRRD